MFHRHELEDAGEISRTSLGGWATRLSFPWSRRAALVVVPEKNRALRYRERVEGLPRPPLVVPNFPLLESFAEPDWDATLRRRSERRQVLFRGAIGPINGCREAVAAMEYSTFAATLRLVGRGGPDFIAELEAIAERAGVRRRIELAGFVPFERLNVESRDASVGLLLYHPVNTNWTFTATAANKLYEYAACGVPVVVPDHPSFREQLGAESWVEFADSTDARSVARGIDRVLGEPARYEARCRAARCAFVERFNYAVSFAPLFEEILTLASGPLGGGVDR